MGREGNVMDNEPPIEGKYLGPHRTRRPLCGRSPEQVGLGSVRVRDLPGRIEECMVKAMWDKSPIGLKVRFLTHDRGVVESSIVDCVFEQANGESTLVFIEACVPEARGEEISSGLKTGLFNVPSLEDISDSPNISRALMVFGEVLDDK